MQRPEVKLGTFEELDELYNFYANLKHNDFVTTVGYGVMRLAFHSDVEFTPTQIGTEEFPVYKADGARQEITEHLDAGGQFMVVSNHQDIRLLPKKKPKLHTSFDQYVLASVVRQEEELRELEDDIYIWSKAELSQRTKASRWFIDGMQQIPVFRKQDAINPETGEFDPVLYARLKYATDRLFDASIARHNRGGHGAIMPEGGRAPFDNPTILPLKGGLGLIMQQIDPSIRMKILSFAIDYGPEKSLPNRKPRVQINRPLEFDYSDPARTLQIVHEDMQLANDRVRARR